MTDTKKIKVFVVDDSLLIRTIMTKMIEESSEFELVGTASNGKIALDLIAKTNPDVITMDIEMPEMNGLAALSRIMAEMPTPVIILSAHSKEGADLTITALELGAVDFITKPHPIFSRTIEDIKKEIYIKLRTASLIRVKKIDPIEIDAKSTKHYERKHRISSQQPHDTRSCENIISMGVSTGGPKALSTIIPTIPPDINATFLIVQHMPIGFTEALADRLNTLSRIEVKEAKNGEMLGPGKVFIARGDFHLIVEKNDRTFFTRLSRNGYDSSFRPSIDVLMKSTADHFRDKNIGVIMSGMCADGVEGVRDIKRNGGTVIAQDEETSTIFGMNKIAIQLGCVDHIVPLNKIVPTILDQL